MTRTNTIGETISAHDGHEDLPRDPTAEDAQEVATVRAPVAVATSDAERTAFEAWYIEDAKAIGGPPDMTASYMVGIREGEDYGFGRSMLNGKWRGWQAHAALSKPPALRIDFKQATELLAMFGGEPGEVTLLTGEGHSGRGLYAHYSDYPEEGAEFLGVADEEAVPGKQATDQGGWTVAARDVMAERQRQISTEGWTPEHDDHHVDGGMAMAAAAYAVSSTGHAEHSFFITSLWKWTGWGSSWFKPKGQRHDLIRAAALILAEIERLDRAAAPTLLGVADGDAVGGKSGGAA